jgi:hypothetical protein
VEWGYYPKITYIYQKINMPKEVKIVDRTIRKDPKTGKMVKHENVYDKIFTEKYTTVSKGGKLRKEVVGINRKGGTQFNVSKKVQEPDTEEGVTISKYNRSGDLKKKVSLVKDESGVIKKTVSRPGKKDINVRAGLLANRIIKKYI